MKIILAEELIRAALRLNLTSPLVAEENRLTELEFRVLQVAAVGMSERHAAAAYGVDRHRLAESFMSARAKIARAEVAIAKEVVPAQKNRADPEPAEGVAYIDPTTGEERKAGDRGPALTKMAPGERTALRGPLVSAGDLAAPIRQALSELEI